MENCLVSGFVALPPQSIRLEVGALRETVECMEPLCDEIILHLAAEHDFEQELREHFTHPKYSFSLGGPTEEALLRCRGGYILSLDPGDFIAEDQYPRWHDSVIDLGQRPEVEGLLLEVLGEGDSPYKEIALIRNHLGIRPSLELKGFCHHDGSKLRAKYARVQLTRPARSEVSNQLSWWQRIKLAFSGQNVKRQTNYIEIV